jgi:ABC-type transport system substrate-binding protein
MVIGIDRDAIVETVFGSFSPTANGYLSAATPGYTGLSGLFEYDRAQAEAILQSRGWILSENGTRVKAGKPMQVSIIAPPWGSNPEVAQLIKSAWEQLGIRVQLRLAAGFGNLKEIQTANEYNAISLNFFGSDPDLLRPSFSSDGLYNWSQINDPMIDRLLLEGVQEGVSLPQRQAYYDGFSEQAGSQWLILPIRDYVNLVLTTNRVEGLRFSPQGWFPYLIDVRLSP